MKCYAGKQCLRALWEERVRPIIPCARHPDFAIAQLRLGTRQAFTSLTGRRPLICIIETLRSTTRPVRQRGPNFSSKMSAELFDAVKV